LQPWYDEGWRQLDNTEIWRQLYPPKPKTKGEAILQNLSERIEPQRFELWFKDANVTVDESRVVFNVQSRLAADMIRTNLSTEISAAIEAVFGQPRPFSTEWGNYRSDPPESQPPPKVLAPAPSGPETTPLGNVLSGIVGAY
jgi:chromosomal replication initiation ATPase DnaA